MLSSANMRFLVMMQQRICLTSLSARALAAPCGQDVPCVLTASKQQVILLPSCCSLASIHGQLRGRSKLFFCRAYSDEMRCGVASSIAASRAQALVKCKTCIVTQGSLFVSLSRLCLEMRSVKYLPSTEGNLLALFQ